MSAFMGMYSMVHAHLMTTNGMDRTLRDYKIVGKFDPYYEVSEAGAKIFQKVLSNVRKTSVQDHIPYVNAHDDLHKSDVFDQQNAQYYNEN